MLVLTLLGGTDRKAGAATTVQVPAGRARFVIGRDPACDWALPDRSLALSARHCEILSTPRGWVLRDLSTNGTFVNRSAMRMDGEQLLCEGDRVEMGPYAFEVSLRDAAGPGGPSRALPVAAPSPVSPVEDTAPLVMPPARGGDPAASVPIPTDDDDALTRIRPVPAAQAKPLSPVSPAAPAPVARGPDGAPGDAACAAPVLPARGAVSSAPAAAAEGTSMPANGDTLLSGLSLPPGAMAGLAPAEQAARVGALLRAAVDLLREQLARQARVRGALGSRRAAALSSASPLQLAADTDQALRCLLAGDPHALLAQVGQDLADHDRRLLAAFDGAASRLAADLSPQALARAMPGADVAGRDALYAVLWQRLGLTDAGADWETGLRSAARHHLASAYDDVGQ
ncbi:MAG: type VI secretion system-associated FHA domain protein TagH [Burkholderiaceae bacterium]|nr:type VI secretion system-associated FHA domain protein TagH [Rhodoferax sp.]MCP5270355.1 type VI secretion system-associated FHA domain protein TagH [Burkholderiaceae bacterium]